MYKVPPEQQSLERARLFRNRISRLVLTPLTEFAIEGHVSDSPVPLKDSLDLPRRPFRIGEVWGHAWQSGYFRLTARIPARPQGASLVGHLDFGGEALLYAADGTPIRGLTNGSVFSADEAKTLHPLPDLPPDSELTILLEAAANSLFGVPLETDPPNPGLQQPRYDARIEHARICALDPDLQDLLRDLDILIDLASDLPPGSLRRLRILRTLDKAADAFHGDPADARTCRAILAEALNRPNGPTRLTAFCVGHAHIDTAWLWPLRETVRKLGRTWSTQLDLLDRHPEYRFAASQAYHYDLVRQHYPGLYHRVRDAVRHGRWEPLGAMWVEPDCQLPSGESLVRQLLHGKLFTLRELGKEVDILWLPDTFGFPASLPQILLRAGVRFFMTQKLSWNRTNDFPYSSFRWRGIDGSEVLCHFPPEGTYNSRLTPSALRRAEALFREKDRLDTFLVLYGIGDGGGGPGEEHIERGRRLEDLEGVPACRFSSASDFFADLASSRDLLPVWQGELYLELHRGTFTSQARLKRLNRLCESELRATEFLAGHDLRLWPSGRLDRAWKTLLLNQFHDILPGSSIHEVYEQAWSDLESVLRECRALRQELARTLLNPDSDSLTLINPLSVPTSEPFTLPEGWSAARRDDNLPVTLQEEDGRTVASTPIPPLSCVTLRRVTATPPRPSPGRTDPVLENDLVRYAFDDQGRLISAYHKPLRRELLLPPGGNLLSLYEDTPNEFDAWDIESFYPGQLLGHAECLDLVPLPSGPLRQGLRLSFRVGSSRIRQTVLLRHDSRRLDFVCEVDWKEHRRMLRVAFATVLTTAEPYFDIPFGWVRRPGHTNTSWDQARFETPAQRYAGLSDPDAGVALLNDSKYGYSIRHGVIDLCLLRSPAYPDPLCDRHTHTFTYSLLPHERDLPASDVIDEAERLNNPPITLPGFSAENLRRPFTLESPSVRLTALKKSEHDDSLILRLLETRGTSSEAVLTFPRPVRLTETDLLERPVAQAAEGTRFSLDFPKFGLRTFSVSPLP